MEIFTACQAIDLRGKRKLGNKTEKAYNKVREFIPFINNDEIMYKHIHKVDDLLKNEELFKAIFEGE